MRTACRLRMEATRPVPLPLQAGGAVLLCPLAGLCASLTQRCRRAAPLGGPGCGTYASEPSPPAGCTSQVGGGSRCRWRRRTGGVVLYGVEAWRVAAWSLQLCSVPSIWGNLVPVCCGTCRRQPAVGCVPRVRAGPAGGAGQRGAGGARARPVDAAAAGAAGRWAGHAGSLPGMGAQHARWAWGRCSDGQAGRQEAACVYC